MKWWTNTRCKISFECLWSSNNFNCTFVSWTNVRCLAISVWRNLGSYYFTFYDFFIFWPPQNMYRPIRNKTKIIIKITFDISNPPVHAPWMFWLKGALCCHFKCSLTPYAPKRHTLWLPVYMYVFMVYAPIISVKTQGAGGYPRGIWHFKLFEWQFPHPWVSIKHQIPAPWGPQGEHAVHVYKFHNFPTPGHRRSCQNPDPGIEPNDVKFPWVARPHPTLGLNIDECNNTCYTYTSSKWWKWWAVTLHDRSYTSSVIVPPVPPYPRAPSYLPNCDFTYRNL